ncbi:MAG: MMPL family transporter [Gammaproteobacteria bacterium]|nr:MMPL family transporter [Gammaproteobacteria bacterium]MDE0513889.1 MMPL family transporter [Gammaproteobacteria bacterium]
MMADMKIPLLPDRCIDIILRRRWVVIALATLIMLAVTGGVRFVGVTNDYRSLFDEGNPQLAAFDALEDTYTETNTALIAIAPLEGSVFTRETLGAVEELTEAAWRAPYSTRVDSLTNYNHSEAFGDDLVVEPLVDDAQSLSDADLQRVEEIALNATEIAGRLVARDGRVAGMAITFSLPENPDAAVIEITDYLNTLLDEACTAHPDIACYLTGDVVLNRAFADATRDDMEKLTPIVFLIILVATAVLLRSAIGTLVTILVVMFTVNTTMGFAGWIGTVFNPVNAGVPLIIMTIAVADSIHIVTAALAGVSRGLEKNEAIVESLRSNAWPVFLTSVTTAGGFLTLNSSDSPPFHVLGNLVAFGVLCAFIYSMILLPALLSVLPLRARPVRPDQPGFFDRFGAFVIARRTFLLFFFSLLTVVLISGIPRNELTDNWTQYFDDRYRFRSDTDFVLENLTGMETLEYSLESGSEGGITDPDYMRAVENFAEWFRAQTEVFHVQAFPDIMKRLNKNMHADDPAFYRLPDSAELAAQYLLLYEFSLPFGSDLNNRIDVAKSATRMTVVVSGHTSSQQLRELDARAHDWLLANAPDLATPATGVSITFAHLSQRNINSMLRATIIAMALISFIFVWVFKSVRLGLVSLVPNFLPAALSFGLWGYLVGQVGLAGSVMTAIAFGIIVDDTTHFLSKYLKARRAGHPAPEAVLYTFRTVGQALWTTTLVLVAGFLVFALSGFEVSWSLGLMVTGTISFALLADFLLLPPLLMAIDRKKL